MITLWQEGSAAVSEGGGEESDWPVAFNRKDLEAAFVARGVNVDFHVGQTNLLYGDETKYTKAAVICRYRGVPRVCVVEDFEEQLGDELAEHGVRHAFVSPECVWKIRQRRILLSSCSATELAARVSQAHYAAFSGGIRAGGS